MARKTKSGQNEREQLSLSEAAEHLLNECRMVLPGIQALFGFQLIAVFSDGFDKKLKSAEQQLHFLAVGLSALAVSMIMTPAALHRQSHAREITANFIRTSTRLLLWSMFPLALSLCIDFYIVGQAILDDRTAALLAAALFCVFVLLWFVLPHAPLPEPEDS